LSALDVRFGIEEAKNAVEHAEMLSRKQRVVSARARLQERPQDWRACLQLACAELAGVLNRDALDVVEQVELARACFANAHRLAGTESSTCSACVLETESRTMRLLQEQVCERRRRESLLEWLKEETELESVSEEGESWKGCILPSGDTPQGWDLVEEEIIMDEGLLEQRDSGDLHAVAQNDEQGDDAGPAPSLRKQPPRWRRNRDLLTMLYCLWRRRRYIQSARLFADKDQWKKTLKELGQVTAQEFLDAMDLCGKGASMVQVLQNEAVPRRVKAALRTLDMCMNRVLGTNAHRTTLRHIGFGYRLLWGAPLVFTTPNVADTKHAMVKLMYEGQEVTSWRLLEEGRS
jgi:hypothetical protein